MDGTKIVPNHYPGEYDVRWSILLKIAAWVLGIVGAVAAASLIGAASLAFAAVQKLNIINERQQMVIQNQADMKSDLKDVKDQIESEDYLSRSEFREWIRSPERVSAIKAMIDGKPLREGQ